MNLLLFKYFIKKYLNNLNFFDSTCERVCGTTNLFYSEEESEMLIALSRYVIKKNKDKLFN